MAKARKIKYKQGEVIASGLTKEQIDELEKLLEGKPTEVVFNEDTEQYEIQEQKAPLNRIALSFIQVEKMYKCVIVKYNLETMDSRVETIEDLGTNRNVADSKFSLKITKEFFQR